MSKNVVNYSIILTLLTIFGMIIALSNPEKANITEFNIKEG